MRLLGIDLDDFRSVRGELKLYLRHDMTCLVGANEHGKSNLLTAIHKLTSRDFDEHDVNSHAGKDGLAQITYSFSLSYTEQKDLRAALAAEQASLQGATDDASVARRQACEEALAQIEVSPETTIDVTLDSDDDLFLEIGERIFASTSPVAPQKRGALVQWFHEARPDIRLFEPPADLVDHITSSELDARRNIPFEGLLKLAGVWDDRSDLFSGDVAAQKLLVKASKTLTRKIRGIWTQGAAHTFRLAESGNRLLLTIEDPNTFDSPSRRSLGFKSFLSFYLTLFAETEEVDPEGFVLLFDEPGIHLHPQGQKDLLGELRKLSANNQIVYTTHSPFMIDKNDLTTTVLVRKAIGKKDKGTKLIYKPYGANWHPVNTALGITPADAFFAPDQSLLVEGTSDRIYLGKYMELCRRYTQADLNSFFMMDSDRREEMEAMVRLLVSAERQIVVLSDGDRGGADMARRLKALVGANKPKLRFLDIRKILKLTKDVSIEDALPTDQWLDAVQAYAANIIGSAKDIDREDILKRATTLSLGRAAAESFQAAGLIDRPRDFSKTSVATFYCNALSDAPSQDSPIARICSEVSTALGLRSG